MLGNRSLFPVSLSTDLAFQNVKILPWHPGISNLSHAEKNHLSHMNCGQTDWSCWLKVKGNTTNKKASPKCNYSSKCIPRFFGGKKFSILLAKINMLERIFMCKLYYLKKQWAIFLFQCLINKAIMFLKQKSRYWVITAQFAGCSVYFNRHPHHLKRICMHQNCILPLRSICIAVLTLSWTTETK